jgi:hypothetical protein
MAKPTQLPEWASGAAAVVTPEPNLAKKRLGFVDGERPPFQWFNGWMRRVWEWTAYLDGLHTEAEFLNKPYPWTNSHSFGAGASVTFAGPVGDRLILNAGNVRLDNGGVQASDFFTSPLGVRYHATTQPVRTVMVPMSYGGNSRGWLAVGSGLLSLLPNEVIEVPLTHFMRTGCVVRRVRLAYRNTAPTSVAPSFILIRKVADKVTPGVGQLHELATATGSVGGASHIMSTGDIVSPVADLSSEEWFVRLRSSSNSNGDYALWLEAQIEDPGPRNH